MFAATFPESNLCRRTGARRKISHEFYHNLENQSTPRKNTVANEMCIVRYKRCQRVRIFSIISAKIFAGVTHASPPGVSWNRPLGSRNVAQTVAQVRKICIQITKPVSFSLGEGGGGGVNVTVVRVAHFLPKFICCRNRFKLEVMMCQWSFVFIKWRTNELMLTITEYSYENSKTKLRTARQRLSKM